MPELALVSLNTVLPQVSTPVWEQVGLQGQSVSRQSAAPSKSSSTPFEQSSTRSLGQNRLRLKPEVAPKRPSTFTKIVSPAVADQVRDWSPKVTQAPLPQVAPPFASTTYRSRSAVRPDRAM